MAPLWGLLLASWAAAGALAHKCVHDDYSHRVFPGTNLTSSCPHGSVHYDTQRHAGRALQSSSFLPLRITVLYMSTAGTTDLSADSTTAKAAFLTGTLVPAAIAKWQAMLNVQRVSGALLYTPRCTATYTSSGRCATSSAVLPGGTGEVAITVPATYLAAFTTYDGYGVGTTSAAGAGLADTDFAVYVTAHSTTTCVNNPSTLAYASTIQRDQYDRPTWARINFCPDYIDTAASAYGEQLSTAVHELNHALGFSSSSWPLWRQSDGVTPRTPRDATTGLPASAYSVVNSCGYSTSVAAPSTLAYYPQRGMTGSWLPTATTAAAASTVTWTAPGNSVAQFVTPKAVAAAAAYYACSTLNGPELENHDTTDVSTCGAARADPPLLRST